ncbi:MAG: type II secretion system protein GspE, partial [Gemmatimonadetes bacterium HGW-Gemmatimonadetes-1]
MTMPHAPAGPSHEADHPANRLGDLLLSQGTVSRAQLEAALAEQRTSKHRLGYILVKQGAVHELELTKMLARQYRMPAVDLSRFEVDARMLRLIPADLAIKRMVLPLKREGRTLTVAVADPADQGLMEDLKFITRFDLFPVLAGEHTLKQLIERHYETGDEQLQTILKEMGGVGDDVEIVEDEEEEQAVSVLQAMVDDAP